MSLATQWSEERESEAFRLIDERGCLTFGAMSLIEQLDEHQRAAVVRHLKSCTICAQQQVSLTIATERIRRSGPRVPVPVEARLAARQAIVRGLRSAAATRYTQGRRRRRRIADFILRSPAAAGTVIAMVAAAAGLLMARLFG